MATIAVRGTITSWSRRSPSSMTALIICSSSASRIPCSPPRSTISRSSSAVICASDVTSAPNSRVTQRVIAVSAATSGPSSRPRKSSGPESTSANRSLLASARDFGTSSANTIVNSARITVTTTIETKFAVPRSMPVPASDSASPSARLTAANADARKPMKVRPSCETARNRPGSSSRRRTRRAPGLPSSTSCSTRLRRIDTSAISAATKKPSRIVRMTRKMIAAMGLITSPRRRSPAPPRAPPPCPVSRRPRRSGRCRVAGAARGSAPARRRRACPAGRRG